MANSRPIESHDWLGTGLKALIGAVCSLLVFLFSQLNSTMRELTSAIRVLEVHQIETDKRVQAIEISREVNMASFQKMITDVTDMKLQMSQLNMRVQTVSEFIAGNFKPVKK